MAKQLQIAYYRVSSKKQGSSGLGLESQKILVFDYLKQEPDYEYQDIETGTNCNRKGLSDAIEKCKEVGGRLIIAKLDRLSRDVAFIATLMKNVKVPFYCLDLPDATPFTIHIYAAMAQQEATRAGQRTRDAMAAKVKREHDAGNTDYRPGPRPGKSGFENNEIRFNSQGEKVMTAKEILAARDEAFRKKRESNPHYEKSKVIISTLYGLGLSVGKIVTELNKAGILTNLGKPTWSDMQVHRMLERLELKTKKVKV